MDLLRNLVAITLVAGVPALLVFGAIGAWRWGRWMTTAGAAGITGLVLTAMTAINLTVPRACDEARGVHNRPLLAAIVEEGDCRRTGLGQVELAVLVGLVSTLVVIVGRPPWASTVRR